jgi:hypothetical protein
MKGRREGGEYDEKGREERMEMHVRQEDGHVTLWRLLLPMSIDGRSV